MGRARAGRVNLGLEQGEEAAALIAALRPAAEASRLWQPRALPRGAVLFAEADRPQDLFLMLSGLVKLAYRTGDGQERLKSLIVDLGVFGAADGEHGPTGYRAECLEPSVIVRLPRGFVEARVAGDAATRAAYLAFSGWLLRRKQAREEALLCLAAADRYRRMRAQHPDLMSRLPQGDIARFLGITPVAFSRIKRRLGAT
jgi:CRP-like cAMP-binding protein